MKAIASLAESFEMLPGVGPKTAQRYIAFLLANSSTYAYSLGCQICDLHKQIQQCSLCFNYSENPLCSICSNDSRDSSILCVVKDFEDLKAIESPGSYKGLYHVLGGLLDPMSGIGPEQLKIKELLPRLEKPEELILALDASIEAEATSLYLKKLLKDVPIVVSRIGFGLSVGGSLNYADSLTVTKAIESRLPFNL